MRYLVLLVSLFLPLLCTAVSTQGLDIQPAAQTISADYALGVTHTADVSTDQFVDSIPVSADYRSIDIDSVNIGFNSDSQSHSGGVTIGSVAGPGAKQSNQQLWCLHAVNALHGPPGFIT